LRVPGRGTDLTSVIVSMMVVTISGEPQGAACLNPYVSDMPREDDEQDLFEGASSVEELTDLIVNLRRKLETLPVIEQAKGIIMARWHCSPDEAVELLRRASMGQNRKLRDLAADLVASVVAGESPPAWLEDRP
jgi:hypothetical protein